MARVLRHDGWLPYWLPKAGGEGLARPDTPAELAAVRDWIGARRSLEDFDIVMEGSTLADEPVAAARQVLPWADAGATWWIEADWNNFDVDIARRRIAAGPPRSI